ncbi:MAG: hypothetical protein ACRCT8_18375 [Lacipirellulaceae bacterium]
MDWLRGGGGVNLADYTVWRDNLGLTGVPGQVAGDGDDDGDVDQVDDDIWSMYYGNTLSLTNVG